MCGYRGLPSAVEGTNIRSAALQVWDRVKVTDWPDLLLLPGPEISAISERVRVKNSDSASFGQSQGLTSA